MSQQEAVLLDIADGIARIRMNRPERLNALGDSLNVGLNEALLRVDLDPSVKVVTLTGEGRAFMAGGDVSGLYKDPENGPQSASKIIAVQHQISRTMRRIKPPIIAGVHGAVAGVGVGLTAGSDFAIVNELHGYDIEDLEIGMHASFVKTITEADIVLFAAVIDGDALVMTTSREVRKT